jgi:hypothetical protein
MRVLNDIKVGVWCAVSTTKIIRLIAFSNTVNSEKYTGQVLTPLFENLSYESKKYRSFLQDSATVHTANISLAAFYNIYRDQIISHALLTARPTVVTCDYYLWGSLKVFMKQTLTLSDRAWY